MAMHWCYSQYFVIPIGIYSRNTISTTKLSDRLIDRICITNFFHHSGILLRISHLHQVRSFLQTKVTIINNLRFSVCQPFFSCYNDNSIRSTYSINSSRRSVFEHAHVFNITVIQEVDIIEEHTIYNIQRAGFRIIIVSDTTDTHFRRTTRLSGINYL